jgi:hypothetical protein
MQLIGLTLHEALALANVPVRIYKLNKKPVSHVSPRSLNLIVSCPHPVESVMTAEQMNRWAAKNADECVIVGILDLNAALSESCGALF